jgi:hypothetical protein
MYVRAVPCFYMISIAHLPHMKQTEIGQLRAAYVLKCQIKYVYTKQGSGLRLRS